MYLSSNLSLLLLIILIPAAVFISYIYYRKVSLSKNQKLLLITLRAISLSALFFLILNPSLHFLTAKKNIPINIFLYDESKSMEIGNNDSILNEYRKLLKKSFPVDENQNINYNFSNGLYEENMPADSIDNSSTNYSKTFEELFKLIPPQKIASVNIISDGNINAGNNPSYNLSLYNIPINYIPIGDTAQKKDILISDVYYNKTNYIQSVCPIKVIVNSYQINKNKKIILYEEGKEISEQTINLRGDITSYEVDFSVASEKEAFKRYTVRCETEDGEITEKNNYQDFYLKFIDNKFNVLVMSGAPSPDFALLKSELNRIQNFRIKYLTLKNSSGFYEGNYEGLKNINCLILVGFPSKQADDNMLKIIYDDEAKYNVPIFYIDEAGTDLNKLKKFEPFLSFKIVDGTVNEIQTALRTITNSKYKSYDLVTGFSPVFLKQNSFEVNPGSEIYILSDKSSTPVLSVFKSTGIRSANFLAYNFYKWRLSQKVYDYSSFFNEMITKTISDIVELENNKKIKLTVGTNILSVNQNSDFEVSILNAETLQKEIKVTLIKDNISKSLLISQTGENQYKGNLQIKEKGEYELHAELFEDGIKTAEDMQKILVDENNLEFKITKSNQNILSQISSLTGGEKFNIGDISLIDSKLNTLRQNKTTEYRDENILNFRSSIWFLLLTILPIIVEWYFRKKLFNLR